MNPKTILTCAVTGADDTAFKFPAVPVTPAEIATACIEAANAGAAIVHIHVRDPKTGKPSMQLDLYAEVVERIRAMLPCYASELQARGHSFFLPVLMYILSFFCPGGSRP